MDAAAADKLTATLVSLTNAWFDDHLYRFLERLQDNFHRRALDSRDESEQQALLNQQQRIRSGQDEAYRQFTRQLQQKISGATPYIPGYHPKLDLLMQRCDQQQNPQLSERASRLCRAISPMSILAGFQQLTDPLKIDSQHLSQSLTLFNVLVMREIQQLYDSLLNQLPDSGDEQSGGLDGWIAHIERQLNQQNLTAQQRALNEARLARLRSRHSGAPASRSQETLSDQQLLREAAAIFTRCRLNRQQQFPPRMLASLNTLQTLVSGVALQERRLFLNPLHPARQLSQQLVSGSLRWQQADPLLQEEFESALHRIVRKLRNSELNSEAFTAQQADVDHCCQQLVQSAKLNDRRRLHLEAGKRRVTRLRRKVHTLIDQKTHGVNLPASVDNLLYGPMTSILLYHWLRNGSNSDALRRNLGLVDDILWYIKPHREWALMRRAKAMGSDIEQRLLDGLKRVNVDDSSARTLIDELHQLRLIASGLSGISGQGDRH